MRKVVAVPGLRGIWISPGPRVPPELAGRVVPYERTLRDWVITSEGGRFRIGSFSSTPVAVFGSERAAAIARRARYRALRTLWRDGTLDVCDEARPVASQRMDAGVALVASGVLVGVLVVIGARLFWMLADLGVLSAQRQLAAAAAALVLLLLVAWLCSGWFILARDCLRARLITSCRLTARELSVVTADGRVLCSSPLRVSAIRGLGAPIAWLEGGEVVYLTPRIVWMLRHGPEAEDAAGLRRFWRAAFGGLLVFALAAPLSLYIGEGAITTEGLRRYVTVLMVSTGMVVVIPLLLFWLERGRHAPRADRGGWR